MSPPPIPDPAGPPDPAGGGAGVRRVRGSGCPLCGRPIAAAHHPFCSQGCRDRDLLAWLGDDYRMPGRAIDPMADDIGPDALDSDGAAPL